jgi:hypothetical protein
VRGSNVVVRVGKSEGIENRGDYQGEVPRVKIRRARSGIWGRVE